MSILKIVVSSANTGSMFSLIKDFFSTFYMQYLNLVDRFRDKKNLTGDLKYQFELTISLNIP